MKFCIIGLGVFGRSLARELAREGAEVIAFDDKDETVHQIKDQVSFAAVLDATDLEALRRFPLAEMDAVIVAVGDNFERSLLITAHVQELGARRVLARVISPVHGRLLKLMKVEKAFVPEAMAAASLAGSLLLTGVQACHEIGPQHVLVEVPAGATLLGRALMQEPTLADYGLQLLAVHRPPSVLAGILDASLRTLCPPPADLRVGAGDVLVLFGTEQAVREFLREFGEGAD